MWSKKEIVIFFAGALTMHTFSHFILQFTKALPISFSLTPQLNTYAIIISTLTTLGVLWWAYKLK